MGILKDSKLLLVSLLIILLSEAIGQIKISLVMVFPMLYSMLMGGIVSFPKFKILNEQNMARASSIMSVALVILIAKLSTSVGASWEKIIQAGGALILQEVGHFIGTILLGLPLAIMLGMGREAVGATYSIGREPNIAIIEAKYGLSSPEGRGVMAMYICGTLYGAVWMGIIASVIAGLDIMSPLALAMGAGVGSGSMLAASVAPLLELYPQHAADIQAFSSSANLMSSVLGLYIYIFFSLPFASFLYNKLKRKRATASADTE
ncbi:DUF3100 domain-containing protein [Providencia rettgeri]|uniref:DUF3100 domain-containing protein n=1 Tax=Providencia sp. TaxID=589 RepID=UPI0024AC4677|nr:DUF3100 domain-containing protein [Providencia rettgeri]ELR5233719.1 DUF3100 domain-containing protein [Providencia rettgeri]